MHSNDTRESTLQDTARGLDSNIYNNDNNGSELQNRAREDWEAMCIAMIRREVSYRIQQEDWIAIYTTTIIMELSHRIEQERTG